MPGRSAAQQRSLTACVYGGEVARLNARGTMADAVDAAMLANQQADLQPVVDLLSGDPGFARLRAGNHSVLGERDPPECHLHRCALTGHWPCK